MRRPTSIPSNFSEIVAASRFVHNFSQRALAKCCGCSQAHIARLELGYIDPSLSLIARLMEVLDIDCCVVFKTNKERRRHAAWPEA